MREDHPSYSLIFYAGMFNPPCATDSVSSQANDYLSMVDVRCHDGLPEIRYWIKFIVVKDHV